MFFDPVKRLKLNTMEANRKAVKLTSSEVIEYWELSDITFTLLIKSQMLNFCFDLEEILSFSLTHVPHSLGTADGFLTKTNKASMLLFLMEDTPTDIPHPTNTFHVEDGNALFHVL